MANGLTVIHVLDRDASERERGMLGDQDVQGIRACAPSLAPHCRHVSLDLEGWTLLSAIAGLRRVRRPPDGRALFHCYSRRGAAALRVAFGRRWPIVLSVGEEAEPVSLPFRIAGPDRLIRHGFASGSAGFACLQVCDGGVGREAIRGAMGIGADECVVGALADPAGATNARWLVFFAGILVAGGVSLTVLVPRGAAQVARMRRFHATTRLNLRVLVVDSGCEVGGAGSDEVSAWRACDVAIVRPDVHATCVSGWAIGRAIGRSHMSGVPVIAPRELAPEALYSGALEERLVVSAATTKQMARCLSVMIEDRGLRVETALLARRAAEGAMGADRLQEEFIAAYSVGSRQWAGTPGTMEVLA
ncbi:MAG: hypothetical protein KF705_07775 [Phycisphaeraceae bacterium]|nr:hypothetical protein [Phycisphaeraceae bacterium]